LSVPTTASFIGKNKLPGKVSSQANHPKSNHSTVPTTVAGTIRTTAEQNQRRKSPTQKLGSHKLAHGVYHEDFSNHNDSPINFGEPKRGPGDFPLKPSSKKINARQEDIDDNK
jgi:hypothetical protein